MRYKNIKKIIIYADTKTMLTKYKIKKKKLCEKKKIHNISWLNKNEL